MTSQSGNNTLCRYEIRPDYHQVKLLRKIYMVCLLNCFYWLKGVVTGREEAMPPQCTLLAVIAYIKLDVSHQFFRMNVDHYARTVVAYTLYILLKIRLRIPIPTRSYIQRIYIN